MIAVEVMEVIARLFDCARGSADAAAAYTQ